jgi:hypothetical protein
MCRAALCGWTSGGWDHWVVARNKATNGVIFARPFDDIWEAEAYLVHLDNSIIKAEMILDVKIEYAFIRISNIGRPQ